MQPPERWPMRATLHRPRAARHRLESLPAGATRSTWVTAVVAGCPPAKRRLDTRPSQISESDVASGDSFHTPNSAVNYTPPEAGSLAS